MIKLQKTSRPQVLADHEEEWTAASVAAAAVGPIPDNVRRVYRRSEIKDALVAETCSKCAYCESRMLSVDYGNVEHIRPLSKNPHLIVDWENLTLACTVCNTNKGDYDSDDHPLINPYVQDPEQHVMFAGPWAWPDSGDGLGSRTIVRIKLNRPALLLERAERLDTLGSLLARWEKLEGDAKELIRNQIIELGEGREQFAATIRAFLRHHTDWPSEKLEAGFKS